MELFIRQLQTVPQWAWYAAGIALFVYVGFSIAEKIMIKKGKIKPAEKHLKAKESVANDSRTDKPDSI